LTQVFVRDAKQSDKADVLSYCVDTFEWGDYIDQVFDRWTKESDGRLLVAEVDGYPAGILHIRLMKHGRAWLEGLRVAPKYRRQGLATALDRRAFELLREGGFKSVRVFIEASNEPSRAHAEAMGFRQDVEWAFFHGKAPSKKPCEGSEWATSGSIERVWTILEGSDVFNRTGRSYEMSWALYPLEKSDLVELARERRVATCSRGGSAAVAVVGRDEDQPRELRACFLTGSTANVQELADFILTSAAESRVRRVLASCPHTVELVSSLRKAGFRPSSSVTLVYFKDL
jgi:GNAT superfamily N-acetyltransferase